MRWFWQPQQQPHPPPPAPHEAPSSNTSTTSSSSSHLTLQTLKANLTSPPTLIATALLTTTLLLTRHIYTTHLRRIPTVAHIPLTLLPAPTTHAPPTTNPASLLGRVTSVGDGDNFRLYHTPGGLLLGWTWARRPPTSKPSLRDQTLHVRLAGVDAPELAHFGKPAQRGGREALAWLRAALPEGRAVRAYLLRRDQYGRVVARCFVRSWWGGWGRDVGLEMVKAGWAGVYEARFGREFGGEGVEEVYVEAERRAKRERRGMWGNGVEEVEGEERRGFWRWVRRILGWGGSKEERIETPREFKTRTAKADEGATEEEKRK